MFVLWLIALFSIFGQGSPAQAKGEIAPVIVQIPSKLPSGNPVNDKIWVEFYPASATAVRPAPAIVLLHPIGQAADDALDKFMHHLAAHIASRGIGCAFMTLPYHLQRSPGGINSVANFVGPKVSDVVQAMSQSASDVSTVADWLSARPDVDAHRLGVVGISLGAIVAHLAMGQDARLNAGVAIEGGGNLPDLYRDSLEIRLHSEYNASLLT